MALISLYFLSLFLRQFLRSFWRWLHKKLRPRNLRRHHYRRKKRAPSLPPNLQALTEQELQERNHQAKNHPHHKAKPDWVEPEILRLKALMGKGGTCRQIANTFNRLHGPAVTVGRTHVSELIKQNQYLIAEIKRDIRNKKPRPCANNHTWALDLTTITDEGGQEHKALGIIDHGSRLLLRLKTTANKKSLTILGHLFLAMGKYGIPKNIRTDNDKTFTSFVFKAFLKAAGIKHQTTRPRSPWQNGRIERLFGTLKQSLNLLRLRTGAGVEKALGEFAIYYNHIRPHQNLNGNTPAEVWRTGSVEAADWEAKNKTLKSAQLVSYLDGTLVGYYIRR